MKNFTYKELKMIKKALAMEIMRREDDRNTNLDELRQFDDLYEKVYDMIKGGKYEE